MEDFDGQTARRSREMSEQQADKTTAPGDASQGGGQFEVWHRHFTEAIGQWIRLVPSEIVRAGGAMYFVRLPDRPASADGTQQSGQLNEEEWKALGWPFRDGVRSARPKPNADSDLGKASLALADVCRSFRSDLLEGEAGAVERLEYALAAASELLKESSDPVTTGLKDAVRDIELVASEIATRRAQIRRQLEEEERKRQEKEEDLRKIAAEMIRLTAAQEERAVDERPDEAADGDANKEAVPEKFRETITEAMDRTGETKSTIRALIKRKDSEPGKKLIQVDKGGQRQAARHDSRQLDRLLADRARLMGSA